MKKYFQFDELGTTYGREIIGGITTFLAMAYVLVVNPLTLTLSSVEGYPDELRMDAGAVFAATALAAAIGSILMGVLAKFPIALAPGMGLNAFFAYTVVLGFGTPWQTALTGALLAGILFVLLSLSGIREKIINAIPMELKHAVGAGIGIFIAFVGFQSSGIIVGNESTLVSIGDLTEADTMLAIFGIIITVILMMRNVRAAIFIGMIITAIVGIIFGQISMPTAVVGAIPDISPTFGAAFEAFGDWNTIFSGDMLIVVLTFLFVAFFDTTGTLISVAQQAGLMKGNELPRAGKGLLADSLAIVAAAILGSSPTTSYVESSAGVAAGAKTGFAAIVAGIMFLLSLFFFPLLSVITSAVTAPAVIIVGVLMAATLKNIEWEKFEIAVPCFFTVVTMALTYSVANGIGIGFIFYPLTMIAAGKGKKVHPLMYTLAVIFILYFIFLV